MDGANRTADENAVTSKPIKPSPGHSFSLDDAQDATAHRGSPDKRHESNGTSERALSLSVLNLSHGLFECQECVWPPKCTQHRRRLDVYISGSKDGATDNPDVPKQAPPRSVRAPTRGPRATSTTPMRVPARNTGERKNHVSGWFRRDNMPHPQRDRLQKLVGGTLRLRLVVSRCRKISLWQAGPRAHCPRQNPLYSQLGIESRG